MDNMNIFVNRLSSTPVQNFFFFFFSSGLKALNVTLKSVKQP